VTRARANPRAIRIINRTGGGLLIGAGVATVTLSGAELIAQGCAASQPAAAAFPFIIIRAVAARA